MLLLLVPLPPSQQQQKGNPAVCWSVPAPLV
jgi:hypothetical protein